MQRPSEDEKNVLVEVQKLNDNEIEPYANEEKLSVKLHELRENLHSLRVERDYDGEKRTIFEDVKKQVKH